MSKSMFESIRKSLEKKQKQASSGGFNDVLRLEKDNTYLVRLLPYRADPDKTFFTYYVQGWTSKATGQYISVISPTTIGERDPISEERFRVLNSKMTSEQQKEDIKAVRRSEKCLVNVLVVEDPVNPENNGKVKMLRYGRQLQKIIESAIAGEDAEEFGEAVFSLDSDGVNLRIKVESQGDFPSYTASRFTRAGKLDLNTQEKEAILNSAFDLSKTVTVKSYDEVKEIFNEHYHCVTINDKKENAKAKKNEERIIEELTSGSTSSIDNFDGDNSDIDGDEEIRKMLDGIGLDD